MIKRIEIAGDVAYWGSEVDRAPGIWETADVARTLSWPSLTEKVPADKIARWILRAPNLDGGFAPWPDISSRGSYTETTARCLLSLLRLQQAAPALADELHGAAIGAAKWILDCQRRDNGGWGSSSGWTPRTSPTIWALLALGEMERLGTPEDDSARRDALQAGIEWLRSTQNADGGYGLSEGKPSNLASTAQVSWALGFRNEPINDHHRDRLIAFLSSPPRADVPDTIEDDPARKFFGRFELLLLSKPLGVLGLMACRVDLRDSLLNRLLDEIEATAGTDALWRIPDGRGVWPTHFYLWAIRTWIAVYESYARAGLTADPITPAIVNLSQGVAVDQHVFLSHSSANKEFVRILARAVEAAGWRTWFDERELVAGSDLVGGILTGITGARAVVLVITDDFNGEERWIGHEVTLAVKQQIERPASMEIIPVVLSGAVDRVPEKVQHLVWKTASSESEAIALVLEALNRKR